MQPFYAVIIAIVAWAVGSIVWAVRLEGRVNLVETLLENSNKQNDLMFSRILAQLDRIERTIVGIKVTCAAFNHKHQEQQDETTG
jgi:hypothetical protein